MNVSLDPMDLAALLCSRVCHDVISPVGAIINGLEVLEEEKDPDTRAFAVDLIKKSAATASAKLQFCRLAFGAAGSAGASIDTGDAENVTRGLLPDEKVKLDWQAPRVLMPKNHVKLLLNMCLIGIAAIPRGGVIVVSTGGESEPYLARVEASGGTVRVAHGVAELLQGETQNGSVDAHAIQPFFTYLVARSTGLTMAMNQQPDRVVIEALREPAAGHHDDDAAEEDAASASGVLSQI